MRQVMGHLPAEVAKWLAPLVIGSLVEAAGCVLEDPTAPGAPTTLAVQVHQSFTYHISTGSSGSECENVVKASRGLLHCLSVAYCALFLGK